MRRSWFRLAKWYADCVTDDGVAFVGYAAQLHLGPISIPYQSAFVSRPDGAPAAAFALRRGPAPRREADALVWHAPRLGVHGAWTPTAPPLHRTLLESDRWLVDWSCHAPAARASVRAGDTTTLIGAGYVEELVVAGDPRGLPIRELWWGRFAAAGRYVVWIVWRGPHPLALVFDNGAERRHGRASRDGLTFDGGRVVCDTHRVLRSGPIGQTFLSSHRAIARLIPRTLRVHEEKWLSTARFEHRDGAAAAGWAIHEVVRWP